MDPMGDRWTRWQGLPLQPRTDRHRYYPCNPTAGDARSGARQRLGRTCRLLRQKNARGTSGAAAVEFALVSLAFISLLLLTMETGWQLLIESAVNTGAMAASRMGSTGVAVAAGITPPPPDRNGSIQAVLIQNSGGLLQADRLQIAEASYASYSALASDTANVNGAIGAGTASQIVHYTIVYTQPYLTPIAAAIAGQSALIHTVQVTVLNEPFPSN
jgi:Flp pilus assembly protein TadG